MPPTDEQRQSYARDGGVKAPGFLNPSQLAQARACFDWGIANPSPVGVTIFRGTRHAHWVDAANPEAWQAGLKALVRSLPFADYLADLWGSGHIWYFAEELFAKRGGEPCAPDGGKIADSPWHQDSSYIPLGGLHWANMWISFEPLPARNSLAFVRGSHRGTLYNGIDPRDLVKPLYPDSDLPLLPDIEADLAGDSASWDVVSWDTEPGDVIVVHPGALHGRAPVDAVTPERNTIVLPFFGDDATYRPLPAGPRSLVDDPTDGAPFRSRRFPQLL